MDGARTCIGPQCREPADRGDLCWGHRKQQQRGQALRPIEKLTPEERVIEAGSAFLEAEDDAEFKTTRARFLRECERMMAAKGWRPPLALKAAEGGSVTVAQLGLGFEVRLRRRSGSR